MEKIVLNMRTDIQSKRLSVAGMNKNGEQYIVQKLKPIKIGE